VGQDQVAHIELSREIVRKFNFHFGGEGKPILVEPHAYLTDVPKILGLDGRKMSKSYGNAVELGEDPESARKRIMVAVTDPARKRRNDPGHPEVCPIYYLHRAYSPPERVQEVEVGCRSAGIGCVDCKKMLLESLVPALEKHRAARAELDRNPARLDELVQLGTAKASKVAEETMAKVRDAVKLP
jgi:tryptophanyl-tRNA synthetase